MLFQHFTKGLIGKSKEPGRRVSGVWSSQVCEHAEKEGNNKEEVLYGILKMNGILFQSSQGRHLKNVFLSVRMCC